MGKLLQKLEQWLGGGPGGAKRITTFRWLLLIGLLGAFIMIMNSFLNVRQVESLDDGRFSPYPNDQEVFVSGEKQTSPFQQYEEKYEQRIKEILEKMVGVGHVDVFVNIESTEEIVVYRNVRETQQTTDEKDRQGASRQVNDVSRSSEIVMNKSGGNDVPIIVKTTKPQIRGIVIVANGAENEVIKQMMLDAVRKGLDVAPHRISISPRKTN